MDVGGSQHGDNAGSIDPLRHAQVTMALCVPGEQSAWCNDAIVTPLYRCDAAMHKNTALQQYG